MRIYSFSYRHNPQLPADALIVDCRKLPNPHRQHPHKDGRNRDVQEFVMKGVASQRLIDRTAEQTTPETHTIAFGCVGGRHRSVAIAEKFAALYPGSTVIHLAL